MVEANVKILQELKWFLRAVSAHAVNRAFFTEKPTDFSRQRELPMERVIAMILDFFKRGLSIEIREFFEVVVGEGPPGKSAFSQQRQKLKALFFQLWNQVLVEGFYRHYGSAVRRWRGFLLVACDGSTLYLPPTEAVAAHFGTQDNQHGRVPMAQVLQLRDVLNHLSVWAYLGPIGRGEGAVLAESLRHCPPGSVLLLDRGLPSFALIYQVQHHAPELHFVMRCRSNFNAEVKAFMASACSDRIATLPITAEAKATLEQLGYSCLTAHTSVRVRMVKVPLTGGGTEVLLSDLLDGRLYSAADLAALYALRWEIETSYGTQKNQLQIEQFSGHTPLCIEQDYYAGVLVQNLQALVEKQCSAHSETMGAGRKYPCRVNTNCSWAALKHNVVRLLMAEEPSVLLLCLQHTFEQHLEPIRPGRKYKRKQKSQRLHGKYHTLTNYKRAI